MEKLAERKNDVEHDNARETKKKRCKPVPVGLPMVW